MIELITMVNIGLIVGIAIEVTAILIIMGRDKQIEQL